MTLGLLWDRISSMASTQSYVRSLTPFDLDQQPDNKLDRAFYLSSSREDTQGYLGGAQCQQHRFIIYLGVRIRRDGWGAERQLLADLEALESTLIADELDQEYYIHDDPGPQHEITHRPGDDYAVGQLQFVAEFDRTP